MDSLTLCTCGHVGKVQGLATDRYNRDLFKFSMCANFKHGKDESELWIQARVIEPHLLQLLLERGLYTGEKLLIISHEATLASALYNGKQTAFLNVLVSGLTFLSQIYPDAIVNTSGVSPRIIQYSDHEGIDHAN
jgi:hypothetical protein